MKKGSFLKTGVCALLTVSLAVTCIPGALAMAENNAQKAAGNEAQRIANAQDAQSTASFEKTEVVYATLSATGSPEALYVVNRFDVTGPGTVVDFGSYDAVHNLTNDAVMEFDGEAVVFDAEEGAFFYQGNVVPGDGQDAVQLPWSVELAYALDGRTVEPSQVAGASGELSIQVKTSRNEAADSAFFESYMLQITFTLDGDTCTDIRAEGATLAAAGRDHTVAFTALPGREGSFELTAQVRDFEMAGAQIAALPYAMVMEMPDTSEMEDGMVQLADAVSQLNSGTASLAQGIDDLTSGAGTLASGASAFGDGLAQLSGSSGDLVDASAEINAALALVASGLEEADLGSMGSILQLSATLHTLADAMDGGEAANYADGLVGAVAQAQYGLAQAQAGLDHYMNALPTGAEVSEEQIQALVAATMAPGKDANDQPVAVPTEATATAQLLAEYYAAAAAARAVYFGTSDTSGAQAALKGTGTLLAALSADANTQGSLAFFASALRQMAEGIEDSFTADDLEQLNELVEGMKELAENYALFNDGLVEFSKGLSALTANYAELESGVAQLASGTSQLADGAWTLSNGVGELNANTVTLPDEMRAQIDEMMADYDFPEFEPRSFLSERNEGTAAVQFVLTTQPIEVPEPQEAPEPEEPELTIWDRFLNLFR